MSREVKKTGLMQQQTAVMAYLEDLLKEVPEHTESEVPDNIVEVFPKQKLTGLKKKTDPANDPGRISKVIPNKAAIEKKPAVEAESVAQAETRKQVQIPGWAEQEFQCLLFHVVGITLAVPLVKLNGVIPWKEDLTPMPGHSAGFLGILRHLEKNVQVMDTAEVILPDSQRQQISPASERVQKILLMDEGKWGLACDDIGEVITLHHTDVRWRTAEGRRAWLAGTVSERLCALLDTDELAKNLAEGEKN